VSVGVRAESGRLPHESGDCRIKFSPTDRGSEKRELTARA